MSRVPSCRTCLRAHVLTCLRAFASDVPYFFYVPSFFYIPYLTFIFVMCLTFTHFCTCLACPHFLRAWRGLFFLCALRAFLFFVPYVISFFYVNYVPSSFYLPYVPSSFYVPYVSNFWRALCAFTFFIKYGTTHNQPQQSGISKNEVEWTKNSLNKPKQLWAILKSYF